MNAARWERVKELFAAVQPLPETERAARLSVECGGDPTLRREVEDLLAAGAEAGAFLETPPHVEATFVGREIGGWRLEAEVGRGGMGVVHKAVREHEGFRQEAALKLLRRDVYSAGMVSRFEQERRILARLRHPGIASLLDGGRTPEGQPWLAMEFVEGKPIHAHCAESRLGVRARLELFREACAAVAYAHRSLVVHRDLKPSNVLVNAEGRVKLLDFGIARLLLADDTDPAALETATLLPALTPEYASPEQVRGEPVTTASDVYSLGVLLCELLTGERPYAVGRSPEEIVRAVCETVPTRPSALLQRGATRAPGGVGASELLGDLDTIVLKALRKEPERRYASVTELDEDVRRHLAGLPVRARPDTVRYRLGKFVSRHRAASAAFVVALLSVVIGVAATLRQARIAEWNRARAERRFAETRQLAKTLLFDIHGEVAKLPGSLRARERIVTSGAQYLEGLSKDAEGDVPLQLELAAAWTQLGLLQGGVFIANLGDRDAAQRSFGRARALAEAAAAAAPDNPAVWLRLGGLLLRSGQQGMAHGDMKGSLSDLDLARSSFAKGVALRPNDFDLRQGHAEARGAYAVALAMNDRMEEALAEVREAVAIFDTLLLERPQDPDLRDEAATILERQGQAEEEVAPGQGAGLPAFRRSLALREVLLSESPEDPSLLHGVMGSNANMADAFERMGDLESAVAAQDRSLVLAERIAAADPADAQARSDLGYVLLRRAFLDTRRGRPREGLPGLERARKIFEDLLAVDPGHAQVRVRMNDTMIAEGRAWAALATTGPRAERAAARPRAIALRREATAQLVNLEKEGLVVGSERAALTALPEEIAALERLGASK
jgi:non-specific serine/threonine protein kinase/serine/threonine-protein kinase